MNHPIPKILLIEDESEMRWLLAESLKNIKADFTFAVSVESGKKEIDQSKFDLIVSDYNLGDGVGVDVLKYLRQSNNQTPFILFTGMPDLLPEMRSQNFYYIPKPEVGVLLDQVNKLLFKSKKLPK